ncbi:hypothetical protein [Mesobacillus foraminis]|uniref:Peptidase S59 domain-containing protein n=1 Tax=Mesobacillus foraminis TaxID=279826 RepID=A0A4R2BGG0_9BACI|nr:hypothetical protein [Mesobacillus foraminis]TCN25462.1 hypothetical protein EV146_105119 [Mesobacillus foraminis]
MTFEEYDYITGEYYFKIDSTHSIIYVYKNNKEFGSIPNNYNREINKSEFTQLIHHYSEKYL